MYSAPYLTRYVTPGGDTVTVTAYRGTQSHGHLTGNPLDATDPGPGRLDITDVGGKTARLALTPDVIVMLRGMLSQASDVMESRLVENDKPHPDAVQQENT